MCTIQVDPFQQYLAAWTKERETAIQPVASLEAKASEKLRGIHLKLDRLLDAHLDGVVEKSEYQAKKEALLNQKLEIDERLTKLRHGATGWLEPCHTFLLAAHSADTLQATGDLESQKNFLKKTGSNYQLAAKTLRFSYDLPWSFLAENGAKKIWRPRVDEFQTACIALAA